MWEGLEVSGVGGTGSKMWEGLEVSGVGGAGSELCGKGWK